MGLDSLTTNAIAGDTSRSYVKKVFEDNFGKKIKLSGDQNKELRHFLHSTCPDVFGEDQAKATSDDVCKANKEYDIHLQYALRIDFFVPVVKMFQSGIKAMSAIMDRNFLKNVIVDGDMPKAYCEDATRQLGEIGAYKVLWDIFVEASYDPTRELAFKVMMEKGAYKAIVEGLNKLDPEDRLIIDVKERLGVYSIEGNNLQILFLKDKTLEIKIRKKMLSDMLFDNRYFDRRRLALCNIITQPDAQFDIQLMEIVKQNVQPKAEEE